MDNYCQKSSWIIIFLITYVVFTINGFDAHADARLAVKLVGLESVKLKKKMILLKDLVHIDGNDSVLNQRIEQVEMGMVPQLGRSRTIDEKDIRLALARAGVGSEKIEITLSKPISVMRASIRVSRKFIENAVKRYIINHISYKKSAVIIKEIRYPSQVHLPKGKLTYQIQSKYHVNYIGNVSLAIVFKVNEQFEKRLPVIARVEVIDNVVVSSNLISRGQIIQKSDLELRTLELSKINGQPLTDIDDMLGKRASRHIYPQKVILESDVEIPPVLKRGDNVKIVVFLSNIVATARGVVRESGRIGDKVKVVNIDSKKTLYATIIDKNTVRIDL
jgi:flagella basal body P-ring formation protein FlgA